MLPMKNKFRHEALLSLLVSFITNGTDIIDFFSYVDEKRIFAEEQLVLCILTLFSLSTLQFSFTLSAKLERDSKLNKGLRETVKEALFCTDMWSLLTVFLIQDFPFMITRTYVIIYYGTEKNYSLYFYVFKNYVWCIFELYAVVNIILDERHLRKLRLEEIGLRSSCLDREV
jgi:hypothetical protein